MLRARLQIPRRTRAARTKRPAGTSEPTRLETQIHNEEQLTREYAKMVQGIAGRLKREMRLRVDFDDLVQLGMMGLLEAWRRFDPEAGVPFRAWAYLRVKGNIIDALPSMTGCSRAQLRILRRLRAANDYSESLEDAYQDRNDASSDASYIAQAVGGVLFLDDIAQLSEHTDDVADASATGVRSAFRANPEQIARQNQMRALIHECLGAIDPDEAHLLREHYFNDRSLTDLAVEMGVSRSWASRVHTRAVDNIRKIMRDRGEYR